MFWSATNSLLATDIALLTREAFSVGTRGGGALAGIGYVVQIILSLGIILGLIYVTLKFLLPKIAVAGKGKYIHVLDRVGLEPSVSAYILKVGRQAFLVMVSAKTVSYIDKVEVSENVNLGPGPAGAQK